VRRRRHLRIGNADGLELARIAENTKRLAALTGSTNQAAKSGQQTLNKRMKACSELAPR